LVKRAVSRPGPHDVLRAPKRQGVPMVAVFLSWLLVLAGAVFLLRRITSPSGRKVFRPCLEALDQRIVPETRIFIGGLAGGSWQVPGNFQTGSTPGNGDDVVIAAGAAASRADLPGLILNSLTVQANYAHTLTVAADLNVNGTLAQNAGTVDVSTNVHLTANNYTLAGQTLSVAGFLTVNLTLTQSGGTASVLGSGTLTTGTYTLSGGSLTMDGQGTVDG